MKVLKTALETIKQECGKHKGCYTCPLFVVNENCVNSYCSISVEGRMPEEWDVDTMIR
jgi:hypothetical protein